MRPAYHKLLDSSQQCRGPFHVVIRAHDSGDLPDCCRERSLAAEVAQHKEAAASAREELQQAQEVCREMLAARRSAREALSDMAQQNARLVSAYVEKKQELRHLQDSIREERLQWQARQTTSRLCSISTAPLSVYAPLWNKTVVVIGTNTKTNL